MATLVVDATATQPPHAACGKSAQPGSDICLDEICAKIKVILSRCPIGLAGIAMGIISFLDHKAQINGFIMLYLRGDYIEVK